MNLFEIGQIPYKEKKLLVSEACAMYRKLKNTEKIFRNKSLNASDVVKAKNLINIKSTSIFDIILGLLSKEHFEVIQNDFINSEIIPSNWYEEKYSKTTFYKIKHDALNHFLFLIFA